jgi:hypothetical protein
MGLMGYGSLGGWVVDGIAITSGALSYKRGQNADCSDMRKSPSIYYLTTIHLPFSCIVAK